MASSQTQKPNTATAELRAVWSELLEGVLVVAAVMLIGAALDLTVATSLLEDISSWLRADDRLIKATTLVASVTSVVMAAPHLVQAIRQRTSVRRGPGLPTETTTAETLVEPTLEFLVAALEDGDRLVRWRAAEGLGLLGNPQAVEPLIAALKDDDRGVRWRAAEALGQLGDPQAVEPLIAALEDGNWEVRWRAAEVLGDLGDPRSAQPLIAALGDSDERVQWAAAEALEKLGTTEALTALGEWQH